QGLLSVRREFNELNFEQRVVVVGGYFVGRASCALCHRVAQHERRHHGHEKQSLLLHETSLLLVDWVRRQRRIYPPPDFSIVVRARPLLSLSPATRAMSPSCARRACRRRRDAGKPALFHT